MPELPEAETVCIGLRKKAINKKIVSVTVLYGKMIRETSPEEFSGKLAGQTFRRIERRGKYLIFVFDDLILLSHMRMEGRYCFGKQENPKKHEHVIFYLEGGETLRYKDTRKFGTMRIFPTADLNEVLSLPPLSLLGPEPLSDEFDVSYLVKKTENRKRTIKSVLLDQTVIAGIGNIYADEACARAGILPMRSASSLKREETEKLIKAIKEVITRAVELGGTTIRTFVSVEGLAGRFQNSPGVHGKKICPYCGTKIEKTKTCGRGTYYCPVCQK